MTADSTPTGSTDSPSLQTSKSESFLIQQDITHEQPPLESVNSTTDDKPVVLTVNSEGEPSSNGSKDELHSSSDASNLANNGLMMDVNIADDHLVSSATESLPVIDQLSHVNGETGIKPPQVWSEMLYIVM